MKVTLEQVREALRKDDFDYINDQIGRLMDTAKGALLAEIGYKAGTVVPEDKAEEFDKVSDNYIIEYVRAFLDQVDNERTRTILAVQLEGLLLPSDSFDDGGQGGDGQ